MKRYYFLFFISLFYLIHLAFKFTQVPVPQWFSSYFADVLCLPIIFSYVLLLMRYVKKTPNLCLTIPMIIVGVMITSILFEYILPSFSKKYTADIGDVFAYIGGAIIFYFYQKYTLT
jgi:hypothetical protein